MCKSLSCVIVNPSKAAGRLAMGISTVCKVYRKRPLNMPYNMPVNGRRPVRIAPLAMNCLLLIIKDASGWLRCRRLRVAMLMNKRTRYSTNNIKAATTLANSRATNNPRKNNCSLCSQSAESRMTKVEMPISTNSRMLMRQYHLSCILPHAFFKAMCNIRSGRKYTTAEKSRRMSRERIFTDCI